MLYYAIIGQPPPDCEVQNLTSEENQTISYNIRTFLPLKSALCLYSGDALSNITTPTTNHPHLTPSIHTATRSTAYWPYLAFCNKTTIVSLFPLPQSIAIALL